MRASRATQNAVIATAIVVEVIVLAGHPLFGWGPRPHRLAVTPAALTIRPAQPPGARSVLLALAGAAQRQADHGRPARDRYAYVSLQTWQLADQHVAGARPGRVHGRIVSAWRAGDGAGRTVTLEATPTGARTVTASLGAGSPLPTLSGPTTALNRRLGLGPDASTQAAVQAVASLTTLEPVTPATQAEILRGLAGDAGLADAGSTRDRIGRPGIVIVYTAPAQGTTVRDTLVFAPATGALEEFDRTLVGSPGHLDVAQGGLLADTVYLRSAWVARIGARPSPG